jgi:hypothetical protein
MAQIVIAVFCDFKGLRRHSVPLSLRIKPLVIVGIHLWFSFLPGSRAGFENPESSMIF